MAEMMIKQQAYTDSSIWSNMTGFLMPKASALVSLVADVYIELKSKLPVQGIFGPLY